jgi:hypothetical protein
VKNASESSVKAATVPSAAATLRTHIPLHGAPTTRAKPVTYPKCARPTIWS